MLRARSEDERLPGAPTRAFDHADWTFESKLDRSPAVACVEVGVVRLVSRKRDVYVRVTRSRHGSENRRLRNHSGCELHSKGELPTSFFWISF